MRPGDLLEQRYRLVRVLGRGRSGSVWCARNELIDRPVAIKVLHRALATEPERLQRFFQEARACGRVRHPAVVEVLDLGQADDGVLFLVMELLEGETLSSLLSRRGRLQVDEALALMVPIARGLEAAHGHGILHRDLKPANVYLHRTPTGSLQPKILDFGISKILGNDFTAAGVVLGTPSYMSPEQVRGDELDARTDLWSLGVILYECLAGRLPFLSRDYRPLCEEILDKPHPPIAELVQGAPSDIGRVVDELLDKVRDRRLSSASVLAQRLTAVLKQQGRLDLIREPDEEFSDGAPTLARDASQMPGLAALRASSSASSVSSASSSSSSSNASVVTSAPSLSQAGPAPKSANLPPPMSRAERELDASEDPTLQRQAAPSAHPPSPAQEIDISDDAPTMMAGPQPFAPAPSLRPKPPRPPPSGRAPSASTAAIAAKVAGGRRPDEERNPRPAAGAPPKAPKSMAPAPSPTPEAKARAERPTDPPPRPSMTREWEISAARAASGRVEESQAGPLPALATSDLFEDDEPTLVGGRPPELFGKKPRDFDQTVADFIPPTKQMGSLPEHADAPLPYLSPGPLSPLAPLATQAPLDRAAPDASRISREAREQVPRKDHSSLGPIPGFNAPAPHAARHASTPPPPPLGHRPLASTPPPPPPARRSTPPPPKARPAPGSLPPPLPPSALTRGSTPAPSLFEPRLATPAPITMEIAALTPLPAKPQPPPRKPAAPHRPTLRPPVEGFAAPAPLPAHTPSAPIPALALGAFPPLPPMQSPPVGLREPSGAGSFPHATPADLIALAQPPHRSGTEASLPSEVAAATLTPPRIDVRDGSRRDRPIVVPLLAAASVLLFVLGATLGTWAAGRGRHTLTTPDLSELTATNANATEATETKPAAKKHAKHDDDEPTPKAKASESAAASATAPAPSATASSAPTAATATAPTTTATALVAARPNATATAPKPNTTPKPTGTAGPKPLPKPTSTATAKPTTTTKPAPTTPPKKKKDPLSSMLQ
jgi:serine/threonine-protein kinase